MKYSIIIASSAFLLAACDVVKDNAQDGFTAVDDGYHGTRDSVVAVKDGAVEAGQHAAGLGEAAKERAFDMTDHVAYWLTPMPKEVPKPVTSSYCYHTLQDILCYRMPMPGWENRLVAYQGTDAPPPPPATMELMAKGAVVAAPLPQARAAEAKPIFAEVPADPTVKNKNSTSDVPAVVDASHEQLPDPTLAPQL